MTNHYFHSNRPVVLGLAGNAASGKTVTAVHLAPIASMVDESDDALEAPIQWNRLFFAMPIYQMVRARRDIEGAMAKDRMKYDIHDTLLEVFGNSPLYGAPPYARLVEMVHEIVATPITEDGKPRSFMQAVGTDICRAYDPECWVGWMSRKVEQLFREFRSELPEDSETRYAVVIDDVRFPNEAKFVAEQANGILLKLVVDPEVQAQRLFNRDGVVMSPEQLAHASEQSVNEIPDEWFTEIIDTTEMDVKDQVTYIRKVVMSRFGEL